MERDSYVHKDLAEPIQETIRIGKNTWGFQKIEISSDARFLRPEKRILGTDEFAGSTYDLNFILDTNLMHAGNNYARLTISTGIQTLAIEIEGMTPLRSCSLYSFILLTGKNKKLIKYWSLWNRRSIV